jgi:hypothetical protein
MYCTSVAAAFSVHPSPATNAHDRCPHPAAANALYYVCPGVAEYTHGGDTDCRTCPTNAIAVATKDNCMCNSGYVPKTGTSSRANSLQCIACAAGKFSVAGDTGCKACTGNIYSSAGAGRCEACPAGTQANAGKTDCVCSGSNCNKTNSGWATVCTCANVSRTKGELHARHDVRIVLVLRASQAKA